MAPEQVRILSAGNDGIGIAAEDRANIFDEFAQVRRQTGKRQRDGGGVWRVTVAAPGADV